MEKGENNKKVFIIFGIVIVVIIVLIILLMLLFKLFITPAINIGFGDISYNINESYKVVDKFYSFQKNKDYDSAAGLIDANISTIEKIKQRMKDQETNAGDIINYTQVKFSTWIDMKYGRIVDITYYVVRTKINITDEIATFKDNSTDSYMIGIYNSKLDKVS